MTIAKNFERFQIVNFKKTGGQFFSSKYYESKKPMLRQIEWGVRNGLITKNGRLPPTTSFWKI